MHAEAQGDIHGRRGMLCPLRERYQGVPQVSLYKDSWSLQRDNRQISKSIKHHSSLTKTEQASHIPSHLKHSVPPTCSSHSSSPRSSALSQQQLLSRRTLAPHRLQRPTMTACSDLASSVVSSYHNPVASRSLTMALFRLGRRFGGWKQYQRGQHLHLW